MPIEKIIDKIISESEDKARSITDDAQKQARKIIEEGEVLTEEEKTRRIKKAIEDIENEKQRKLALARLESRKNILQTRCDILDECFDAALDKMMKMDGESLQNLIAKILDGYVPDSPCEVFVRQSEEEKFARILSALWKDAFGKFCVIKGKPDSFGGGFILREKSVEYDFSFVNIIADVRPLAERKVVETLFPK